MISVSVDYVSINLKTILVISRILSASLAIFVIQSCGLFIVPKYVTRALPNSPASKRPSIHQVRRTSSTQSQCSKHLYMFVTCKLFWLKCPVETNGRKMGWWNEYSIDTNLPLLRVYLSPQHLSCWPTHTIIRVWNVHSLVVIIYATLWQPRRGHHGVRLSEFKSNCPQRRANVPATLPQLTLWKGVHLMAR